MTTTTDICLTRFIRKGYSIRKYSLGNMTRELAETVEKYENGPTEERGFRAHIAAVLCEHIADKTKSAKVRDDHNAQAQKWRKAEWAEIDARREREGATR